MRNAAICTLIFMISAFLTSCKKRKHKQSRAFFFAYRKQLDRCERLYASVAAGAITPASSSNYIGKVGDYFNFTTLRQIVWSINGQKDTATYLISGDTIIFKSSYIDAQTNMVYSASGVGYTIGNLTNHTCTLFNSIAFFGSAAPEGLN